MDQSVPKDRWIRIIPAAILVYIMSFMDRKRDAPVLNLTEAQKIFEAQAAELSKQGVWVRALVINMALR